MRLAQLLHGSGIDLPAGSPDPEITAVVYDSRQAAAGTLFVCLQGQRVDGHDYAHAAARLGAPVVLAERKVETPGALLLIVPSVRRAMAEIAANFHGRPGDALPLVGITGTNGKTTISYLVEAIAEEAGLRPGVMGTVNYRFGGKVRDASHTTPESVELQALLAEMVQAGCDLAVMEVSSHGLSLGRVHGLRFQAAAFTHLTRDHLDFHQDMEAYFEAKARLFREQLAEGATAVLNGDDPYGRRLFEELKARGIRAWRFSASGTEAIGGAAQAGDGMAGEGMAGDAMAGDAMAGSALRREASAELTATDVTFGIRGITATLHTPLGEIRIDSPLVGAHNLQNLLTAAGLALGANMPLDAIARGLSRSGGAPGRLQRVDGPRGVVAFVDYAHTDDALRRACETLREVATGRLITVFGCGGDRDRGKRSLMGEAAGATSDLIVVTSDNPRTEDPASIVEMIVPGVEKAGRKRRSHEEALAGADGFIVELDRRHAIELAVASASSGDVILIAGKGHEDYQILGTTKIHFDDAQEARRALGA